VIDDIAALMPPAAFAAVSLIDDAVDEVDEVDGVDGVDDEPVVEPDELPAPVLALLPLLPRPLLPVTVLVPSEPVPEPGFEPALVALMPLPSVDF
jgi:hypothetical protein